MSETDLESTLQAAGYAKVIVALQPSTMAAAGPERAGRPAAAMRAAESAVTAELENFFVIPSETQAVDLQAAASRAASKKITQADPASKRVRVYPHLGLALGFVDSSGLKAVESHTNVKDVVKAPELSLIRPVAARPAKLTAAASWGIGRLRADRLWDAGYTGKGVIVGHLDTGVDASHPALKGAIAKFAEFDMRGDRVPHAKPWDSDVHGTHTAGTIAGRAGKKGPFGVAPEAKLASAMVIEGGQVIDRILAGLDWIVEEGVRVMSMSLGLRGYTPAFQVVIDALRAADVLPVIAVGNEFANTSRSPGNYANVLSVGAMDRNNRVADFSSSQRFDRADDALVPDLVAPGVEVLSCVPGGKYEEMDGSSMATPHVAGVAALLLQAAPHATATELENAILASCQRRASMPEARANRGVPDAVRALAVLTGEQVSTAVARATKRRRSSTPKKRSVRSRRTKMAAAAPRKTAKRKAGKYKRKAGK